MTRKSQSKKISLDDDELLTQFETEAKRPKLKSLVLNDVTPLTKNQSLVFENYHNNNLVLIGSAGTGKSYLALYLALKEILNEASNIVKPEKIILVRSIVPSRDIGFLPGTLKEKIDIYELPYKQLCAKLFSNDLAYDSLVKRGKIEFISTSFVRGLTFDNAIVIVDEIQNNSYQELHSIITRMGENSRIVLCGDINQTDLNKKTDKSGFDKFVDICCNYLQDWFYTVDFTVEDVVRSGLVKDYLIALDKYDHQF